MAISEYRAGCYRGLFGEFQIVIFLFGLIIFNACSFSPENDSREKVIAVTDFRGKEIKLHKPAEKVVCLIESALSGIYMLRREEKIIAVSSNVYNETLHPYYARLDPRIALKQLPTPGNWDFISLEQIVGLNPDLVIIWASQTGAIENIEQFGIPVYGVMLNSFEDVFKEIRDFGHLLDCSPRADSLINYTRQSLSHISAKYKQPNPKSVYFMWPQGITETSGTNSTVNELLTISGTVNACNLEPEHISVSIEKLYDWNPDMIVMWHNEKMEPEDVINNPLLEELRAVKNKQVYELPDPFACDFWTLKMQYPAELIGSWAANDKTQTIQRPLSSLEEMYFNLFGITMR